MKRLYEMPAIELTKFDVEDVITASTTEVDTQTFMSQTGIDAVATWKSEWTSAWNDNLNI